MILSFLLVRKRGFYLTIRAKTVVSLVGVKINGSGLGYPFTIFPILRKDDNYGYIDYSFNASHCVELWFVMNIFLHQTSSIMQTVKLEGLRKKLHPLNICHAEKYPLHPQ